MRTYQLCTYHLATEEAAADYLPRWKAHIGSLKALEIATHGIFSVPSDPKMVVALISHDASVDPVAIISAYRDSEGFKADMVGFDEANMVQDDKLILKPADGSPLS
jgi:hypothetical protein